MCILLAERVNGVRDGHHSGLADVTRCLAPPPPQDLGVYDTDRDARTACNSALRIVLQYKNQNALLLQVRA